MVVGFLGRHDVANSAGRRGCTAHGHPEVEGRPPPDANTLRDAQLCEYSRRSTSMGSFKLKVSDAPPVQKTT
jgi:hypothetical protein